MTFAPFKLKIIVHGAKKLPVADFTSSDPYAVVLLGGRQTSSGVESDNCKVVGRTQTRHRHLNPKWDEYFNADILHTNTSIIVRIFDEDR